MLVRNNQNHILVGCNHHPAFKIQKTEHVFVLMLLIVITSYDTQLGVF